MLQVGREGWFFSYPWPLVLIVWHWFRLILFICFFLSFGSFKVCLSWVQLIFHEIQFVFLIWLKHYFNIHLGKIQGFSSFIFLKNFRNKTQSKQRYYSWIYRILYTLQQNVPSVFIYILNNIHFMKILIICL